MFVAKEIAQNVAMRSSRARQFAERRHDTGLQGREGGAAHVLSRLTSMVPFELDSRRVLELGPGRGRALMEMTNALGAQVSGFDVRPYLDRHALAAEGIEYVVDASGRLPWPDAIFDVVWSYSVLEHLAQPATSIEDSFRALRPGGLFVASIDLETHMGGRNDPTRMFEFMKYSARTWNAMTSNRSSYLNRLRLSEWRALLERTGYVDIVEQPLVATCSIAALRDQPYLTHLSDEDISTRLVLLRATVPG